MPRAALPRARRRRGCASSPMLWPAGRRPIRSSPQAIVRVPIVPLDRRNEGGNITASLATLGDFPEFALSVGLLDTEGDLALLVAELTEVFARIYLANARDIRTTIAF